MTAMDWSELEKTWQSLPPQAAPAVAELKREARWRWLSTLNIGVEIALALAGAGVGVWLASRGDILSVVLGVATVLFSGAVSASSLWARWLPPVNTENSVMFAIEAAVRRARLGVRLAYAALWSTAASLAFLGVVSFAFMREPRAGDDGLGAIGTALIALAVWLGGTILYFVRRSADLARLEAVKASLAREV